MAGAAVVIKPSEFTPLELMEVIRGWKEEVGGPDIIDFVNGTADTGGALIDNVDYMHFTGSDRTGKVVMKRAADTLTPVSLELGGKDPAIVLADADMDRAVNGRAYGAFVNTGQVCMSIERIYVEEPVYDEFVNRLADQVRELAKAQTAALRAGAGRDDLPAQIDIVSDHVEDARSKGARILTGGKRKDGPGDWYEPTVVADADHTMKVMVDETFGPVVGVMKVRDEAEAIRMANDTRYGLSASVFSKDVERAERSPRARGRRREHQRRPRQLLPPGVPMGGWKDSASAGRTARAASASTAGRSRSSRRASHRQVRAALVPVHAARRKLLNRLYRAVNARGFKNRLGL